MHVHEKLRVENGNLQWGIFSVQALHPRESLDLGEGTRGVGEMKLYHQCHFLQVKYRYLALSDPHFPTHRFSSCRKTRSFVSHVEDFLWQFVVGLRQAFLRINVFSLFCLASWRAIRDKRACRLLADLLWRPKDVYSGFPFASWKLLSPLRPIPALRIAIFLFLPSEPGVWVWTLLIRP